MRKLSGMRRPTGVNSGREMRVSYAWPAAFTR
jgi:hypothetical protein